MAGRILSALGRALIISGLLVLGFVAFQLWGTSIESSRKQDTLRDSLAADMGKTNVRHLDTEDLVTAAEAIDPVTAPPMAPPANGEPIGVISIPRIGVNWVFVAGVTRADLKKGPGHYPGTPLPGQAGNAAIAGHRTTYGAPFNRIDELIPGDEITISTPQGSFTYVVIPAPGEEDQAWYAVKPSQVEVLNDAGDNRLTLTACHPKYSARQRIIVNAVLKTPPAQAVPVSDTTPKPNQTTPKLKPTLSEQFDEGQSGDSSALWRALGFGLAAALIAGIAYFAKRYTKPWAVWLIATPGILAMIWFGYMYLDRYLPPL